MVEAFPVIVSPSDTTSAAVFPTTSSTLFITSTAASKIIEMLPTTSAVAAIATPVAFVTLHVTILMAIVDDNSSGIFIH